MIPKRIFDTVFGLAVVVLHVITYRHKGRIR